MPLEGWRLLDVETEGDRDLFPEAETDFVLEEPGMTGAADERPTLPDLEAFDLAGSMEWLLPIFVFPLFLTTIP